MRYNMAEITKREVKEMYLKMDKESFIEDYMERRTVAETSLRSLFKKTEQYEKKNNKDCSQFTQEEVLAMYKGFKAKSSDVLLNYNTILKAYNQWQLENRYKGSCNVYEKISQDLLEPLVPEEATKLLTREDVYEIEDQLQNWTDKAIVECLWEGLSGNSMLDLVSINSENVDPVNKTITFFDGRTFALTDRLLDFLLRAFDEMEYLCYGECMRTKKLDHRGWLYKERDNAHALASDDKYFRWVYRKIQIFRDYVGIKKFTMKNISASGMYHYLKMGVESTDMDIKSFLQTDAGKTLMDKYGYFSEFRVDNIVHKYRQYFK